MSLETNTLLEVLTLIFGTGSTLAVLLQRIPGWDDAPAGPKLALVTIANVVAPALLVLLKAYVPPDVLAQTPAQLIAGVAALAVAFLIHKLDVLFIHLVELVKGKLAEYTWDDDDLNV